MKKSSGLYTLLLCIAVFALLCPDLLFAQQAVKIPDFIGRANNPYILPDGSGPGFFQSAAIGLVTGMLSAAIGAGGGLLVVPALMSAGISGIYAVGSELFRLFIFSSIQSVRMGINRRINYILALLMTAGTVLGGWLGYSVSKSVFLADPAGSDVFISAIIALWLIIYTFIIVPDFRESAREYALELLKKEQAEKNEEASVQKNQAPAPGQEEANKENGEGNKNGKNEPPAEEPKPENKVQFEDELYPDEKPWEIARTIRSIKFPPYIKFPSSIKEKEEDELEPAELRRGGKEPDIDKTEETGNRAESIPIIPIILLTTVGGFFMTLTGSGGVILTFTILTKGFGCVATLVAGTDLARLALASGGLTMGTFGLNGLVNIYCITGLVFGNITGLHLGSKALKNILPYRVKGLVSLLVISVIINRLLALPGLLRKSGASISSDLASTLDTSGSYILFIGAGLFAGWVIFAFIQGIHQALQPVEEGEDK